ncbi:MAG: hypothetical protein KC561_05365, partial [Myxococcales bacterium]|nr:hypothetical protein [Myxococcales bacterium]
MLELQMRYVILPILVSSVTALTGCLSEELVPFGGEEDGSQTSEDQSGATSGVLGDLPADGFIGSDFEGTDHGGGDEQNNGGGDQEGEQNNGEVDLTLPLNELDNVLVARNRYDGESFFSAPWPSDTRLTETGTPDLSSFPHGNSGLIRPYIDAIEDNVVGYSINPTVYVGLDQAITEAALPSAAATIEDGADLQLMGLGERCGEYIPLNVTFEEGSDRHRDSNVLAAAPVFGFSLTGSTSYALVLRDGFGAADGLDMYLDPMVQQGLAGEGELASVLAPLATCLEELELDSQEIAVATVFTTQDPVGELRVLRASALEADISDITDWHIWEERTVENEYTTYRGAYQTPIFQAGESPYATTGGQFVFDTDGQPIIQRWEEVPFTVTVPAGDGPFKALMWQDGTGAHLASSLGGDLMTTVRANGYAVISFAPQFHGTRATEGSEPVAHTFNYVNPQAGRSVFRQQAVDTSYLIRVLRAHLGEQEGASDIDLGVLVYGGHSQGAMAGALVAAIEDEISAYVLNGVGGYTAVTIEHRVDPIDIAATLSALLGIEGHVDRYQPAVQMAQMGSDVVDPLAYSQEWAGWDENPAGNNVLMVNGMQDHTTHYTSISAITIRADAEVISPAGWDVDPEGVWFRSPGELPISDNRLSLAGTPVT